MGVSSAVGATTSSVCYLFLASDEQSLNVTIDVLDSDGNILNQKTVSGVSFQRNRCTRLTGSVYTVSTAADSFLLNKDWLEGDLEQSF